MLTNKLNEKQKELETNYKEKIKNKELEMQKKYNEKANLMRNQIEKKMYQIKIILYIMG